MTPADSRNSPSPNRPEPERDSDSPGAESPPDGELVEKTLAGDLGAFEILVERYQKAIFNVAYYKSRNAFDAEDLTQDIFLAAYRALGSLKDPESFGGWLFGIAHNRCHKWYRRERTKILKFREIGKLREQELRMSQRSRRQGRHLEEPDEVRLSREIEKLPHEISRVLVLKYLEGLSYEQIQKRLDLKSHRIDYLIRKGKALLKQRLSQREIQ